jgi:K+-sensing histidine kinase KdpD
VVSLGVLAAGLSQQLRNTMDAVHSFLEVAPPHLDNAPLEDLARVQYPEAWARYYARVQSQMDRIEKVLGDVGETARPPVVQFRDQIQPHAALAKAIDRFELKLEERGVKVVNNIPKNLPSLLGDASLFNKMIEALLEESLIVMPVGGAVTVDGVKESDQILRIQASADPGGFSPDALRWIFDPLEELHPEGIRPGLHLLAAFLVVYHHGGVAQLVPESGKGHVLRLLFPMNPDQLMVKEGEHTHLSKLLFSEALWEKFLGQAP